MSAVHFVSRRKRWLLPVLALAVLPAAVVLRRAPLPSPADFYAAMPSSADAAAPELAPIGPTLRRAAPGAVVGPLAVHAQPGADVVFWALDHGAFVANDHYVIVVQADAGGVAATSLRLGSSPGLYRVSAASEATRGCATFHIGAEQR